MKTFLLMVFLLSSSLAQGSYWDTPLQGAGTRQAEALGKINQAKREVFAVVPALYSDLAMALRTLAGRGVSVRVVIASNGIAVSNGLAVLRQTRGIELRQGLSSQAQALVLIDREILLLGQALWDSRKQGWRWLILPPGEGVKLSENLRYLWQAAKPL